MMLAFQLFWADAECFCDLYARCLVGLFHNFISSIPGLGDADALGHLSLTQAEIPTPRANQTQPVPDHHTEHFGGDQVGFRIIGDVLVEWNDDKGRCSVRPVNDLRLGKCRHCAVLYPRNMYCSNTSAIAHLPALMQKIKHGSVTAQVLVPTDSGVEQSGLREVSRYKAERKPEVSSSSIVSSRRENARQELQPTGRSQFYKAAI